MAEVLLIRPTFKQSLLIVKEGKGLDTTWVHILIFSVSFATIILLIMALRKVEKDIFIIRMITLSLMLMITAWLYSAIILYGRIANIVFDVYLLNGASLFIRVQNVSGIFWITVSALRRMVKHE
jgi:hypothetical protein